MYDVLRPGIVEESPKRVDFVGGRTWNARLTGRAGIAQWPRSFGARPLSIFFSSQKCTSYFDSFTN